MNCLLLASLLSELSIHSWPLQVHRLVIKLTVILFKVNQVQQQMAKLGFKQPTSMSNTLGMQNNQAVPNSQAMPGYNYNQAIPGTAPYNNGSGLYANTPLANGGWMPQKAGNFPQPQPMPQYLTTGPAAPGFNMYPGQGSMPSGQTLSHNLWK